MIFMFGLLDLISWTIFVYAARISVVECPCATSFVPSINITTSGFAAASHPTKLVFAMLIARKPECPSWCMSQLGVFATQFCVLSVIEPTNCTLLVRPAAAKLSQTIARQQVISVILSPRGTVFVRIWLYSAFGLPAQGIHLLIFSFV
jgi:hypothetical protein